MSDTPLPAVNPTAETPAHDPSGEQPDPLFAPLVQTFSAYMGAAEVARVAIGVIEASLRKGLHHSRPALEAAVPALRGQLDEISRGLTPP